MQRLAKGKMQKHQNRLMPWWSFAPKKNFFFSYCPLYFFVFRNGKETAMSKKSKSYKNMPKKIYIRTYGWPLVCSLQVGQTVLFYSFSGWVGGNVRGNAPPAWAGLVGGVYTVQPRCRSASLHRSLGRSLIARLGRRACWLGRQHLIRLFVFAAFWVGAKCGKHFSVLNLAKIL